MTTTKYTESHTALRHCALYESMCLHVSRCRLYRWAWVCVTTYIWMDVCVTSPKECRHFAVFSLLNLFCLQFALNDQCSWHLLCLCGFCFEFHSPFPFYSITGSTSIKSLYFVGVQLNLTENALWAFWNHLWNEWWTLKKKTNIMTLNRYSTPFYVALS